MPLAMLTLTLLLITPPTTAVVMREPARVVRPRPAETIAPHAVHVHDGDTFYIGTQAFRLRGIDAPELGRRGGQKAKRRLIELVRAGTLTIIRHAEDVYGRIVVDAFVDGRNLADVLRAEGHAKPRQARGPKRSKTWSRPYFSPTRAGSSLRSFRVGCP